MAYYNKSVATVLRELDTNIEHGLSKTDAEERIRQYGSNALRVKSEPLWRKLIEPFANVFMAVLFIAAVISLAQGDTLDAIIVIAIMATSAVIYYVQRFSTERILRALSKHTTQFVEVLRDGKVRHLDASYLVPGDIITLSEGDKVPADARLVQGSSVRTDESLLTGESLPIAKHSDEISENKEIYEQANILFQGSFIVSGTVTAVVITTGNSTEFGKLAALAQETEVQSPVQVKIDKLISQIVAVVAAMAIVAFVLAVARGMDIGESVKFVMALAVSAVPESLPVAISVILVLGMRRMARKKALVRTMRAIETIGVITTIATDKTGTLTKNKLTVQELWHPTRSITPLHAVLTQSINQGTTKSHDPLDTALYDYCALEKLQAPKAKPMAILPFDQAVAMSGNIWHKGSEYHLSIKGAPEHVLAKSTITEHEHEQAMDALHQLTAQGYRVIAFAETTLKKPIKTFDELPKNARFGFVGFVAIADVLRPEARRAIAAAQDAGVTVRMITGDHFETAYHIGQKLGMVTHRDQVFDSRRMHVMTDEELSEVIENIRVFSRVIPEHKYRILSLLKKHNITAMTGDGVNDVPALANAHVGLAMGSGSQIAKDAGDIILLDDNFKSIIDAMREGRTIIANIRRMLFYLLATSAGGSIALIGALVIGLPVPLLPVQILWINLVTDTALVIPLGLESGEKSAMTRKPNSPNAPILSKYMVTRVVLVALAMASITLGLYASFEALYGHEYARTIAFCALVVMQWANAFNARSDYDSLWTRLRVPNWKFAFGLSIAVILQSLAIFGPLGAILHVTPVAIGDLVITGTAAFLAPIIIVEIHKFFGRRRLGLA